MFTRGNHKLYDENRSICTSESMDDEIQHWPLESAGVVSINDLFFNVATQYMVLFFSAFGSILIPAYLPLQGSPLLVVFHSGP